MTGTITHPDGESASITGWRSVWVAGTRPAKDYLGRHNFIITSDLPDVGAGFGSFTVAANGSLSITGKLPDGTILNCITFLGPTDFPRPHWRGAHLPDFLHQARELHGSASNHAFDKG